MYLVCAFIVCLEMCATLGRHRAARAVRRLPSHPGAVPVADVSGRGQHLQRDEQAHGIVRHQVDALNVGWVSRLWIRGIGLGVGVYRLFHWAYTTIYSVQNQLLEFKVYRYV